MPERIQRRRVKGWRLPPNTIVVSRPSRFGNPFVVGKRIALTYFPFGGQPCEKRSLVTDADRAKELYAAWLDGIFAIGGKCHERRQWVLDHLHELRGKDLACWCRLSDSCHADILLELAAAEVLEND